MVVRLIIGRTGCPIVRVERFKMLASGAQLVAIGVFATAIVAPFFNPSLHPTHTAVVTGGVVAALIELLALRLMGCISPAETRKEDEDA
jgi:peptidoglycan biosynthesis protein MviN/MurJ (putative lipid II flippase)